MGDIIEKYEDPVETPHNGYERLGIRSHAKGTFHSYVEPGKELGTARMHRVAANKFIVNITFGWEHAVAITNDSDAGKLVSHRFPQFSFNKKMIPKFFKYVMVDKKFREHLELSSPGGAGRNRVLKINDMLDYDVKYPNVEEQIKIMKYLSNLDNLITFHQRKLIILSDYFKAWEQRKFKNVFDFLQNNSLSRADLSEEKGNVLNVHYGDILVKFAEVIDIEKEQLPSIKDESILGKYHLSILQNGDVIITDAAEDQTVGKCSEINGIGEQTVLSGLHTIPVRAKEKYASGYMGYYLNSNAYHNQLLPLIQGTKISSISKSIIQGTDIVYPESIEEQAKIGCYFTNLNNLITFHRRAHK